MCIYGIQNNGTQAMQNIVNVFFLWQWLLNDWIQAGESWGEDKLQNIPTHYVLNNTLVLMIRNMITVQNLDVTSDKFDVHRTCC
jgi:hypothetical protein